MSWADDAIEDQISRQKMIEELQAEQELCACQVGNGRPLIRWLTPKHKSPPAVSERAVAGRRSTRPPGVDEEGWRDVQMIRPRKERLGMNRLRRSSKKKRLAEKGRLAEQLGIPANEFVHAPVTIEITEEQWQRWLTTAPGHELIEWLRGTSGDAPQDVHDGVMGQLRNRAELGDPDATAFLHRH